MKGGYNQGYLVKIKMNNKYKDTAWAFHV